MTMLIKPNLAVEEQITDFLEEYANSKEKPVPYSIDQNYSNFQNYIENLINESKGLNLAAGFVPASTFFLANDNGRILGASNLRHYLVPKLEVEGGHIGYGIRPSERNKGFGTLILKLTLEKARQHNIEKALLTCDKSNSSSVKAIKNNGGVFDSENENDGRLIQRYLIDLECTD